MGAMVWLTYLAATNNEDILASDLPGEDQTATALDFGKLVFMFSSHSLCCGVINSIGKLLELRGLSLFPASVVSDACSDNDKEPNYPLTETIRGYFGLAVKNVEPLSL